MKIGLDISGVDPNFKEHAQRGIGRYLSRLRDYFSSPNGQGELRTARIELGEFDHNDFALPQLIEKAINWCPVGRQTIRQQLCYPWQLERGKLKQFEILHFPAHMDAPSWATKDTVVTVLDLIPLVLEQLYAADHPSWRFKLARFLEQRAIKRAAVILAISKATARDVERLLGVPRDNIVVTPLGVDDRFFKAELLEPEEALRSRYGIPIGRPIVLYVGGIDQRKNWQTMVPVIKRLAARAESSGRPKPVLVLGGRIDRDRNFSKLKQLIGDHGADGDLVLPGFIPDSDLLQLFKVAGVFYFPSLYEGFGLPPLEAMAAALPVVSSQAGAMEEVLGEAAIPLSDPNSVDEAVSGLELVLNDAAVIGRLRASGPQQARKFNWAETGRRTIEGYRLAAERIGSEPGRSRGKEAA
jgi:glycosyltransferase involved in cell wall biosynthesis